MSPCHPEFTPGAARRPGPARSSSARKRHRGRSSHPHLHRARPQGPSNSPARRQDPSSHLPSGTAPQLRHTPPGSAPRRPPPAAPAALPSRADLGAPANHRRCLGRWAGLLLTQLRPWRSRGQGDPRQDEGRMSHRREGLLEPDPEGGRAGRRRREPGKGDSHGGTMKKEPREGEEKSLSPGSS